MSSNVFWIASYPKSGNTWVRFIVSSILKGGPIEQSSEIEVLTPDIHIIKRSELPNYVSQLYLKTHWVCSSAMPFYKATVGAVYIVRNPTDVLVSNLHYINIPTESIPAAIDDFINVGGVPSWLNQFGSWIDNLNSWLNQHHPFPINLLRFEDLLANPIEGIQEIGMAIGVPISNEFARKLPNRQVLRN